MLLIIIKFLLVIGIILGIIRLININTNIKKNGSSIKNINKDIPFLISNAPQELKKKIRFWARVIIAGIILLFILFIIAIFLSIFNLFQSVDPYPWYFMVLVGLPAYLLIFCRIKFINILVTVDKKLNTNYLKPNNLFIIRAKVPLIVTLTIIVIFCVLMI